MSYEPTNWKTGDVVTSAKLNKLENAVANGSVMVVHKVAYNGELSNSNYQLDKTWQEIADALKAGTIVMTINEEKGGVAQDIIRTARVLNAFGGSTYYSCLSETSDKCAADSATGYPHMPFEEEEEGGGVS